MTSASLFFGFPSLRAFITRSFAFQFITSLLHLPGTSALRSLLPSSCGVSARSLALRLFSSHTFWLFAFRIPILPLVPRLSTLRLPGYLPTVIGYPPVRCPQFSLHALRLITYSSWFFHSTPRLSVLRFTVLSLAVLAVRSGFLALRLSASSPPVVSSLLGPPVDGSCPPVVGSLALPIFARPLAPSRAISLALRCWSRRYVGATSRFLQHSGSRFSSFGCRFFRYKSRFTIVVTSDFARTSGSIL